MNRPRYTRKGNSSEDSSFTIQQGLLMAVVFVFLATTLQATQPGWWTATHGPLNGNPADDSAAANQGQLKQFTQKAVLYLDAHLAGGAGTNLDNMIAGWSNYYATNGLTYTNPAPADLRLVNEGQLRYIGNLIYGQLSAAGYTGLHPSWLAQNTNTDFTVANLGQLKMVFGFDLSIAPAPVTGLTASSTNPGEIDLSWTLPTINTATSVLIERSFDGGTTWTTLGTPVDPTMTSYADTYTSAPPGAVLYRVSLVNAAGASAPTVLASAILPMPLVPPTPSGLTGYVNDSGTMTLSWTASTGATSYVIDRETISSDIWATATGTTTSTTFADEDHGNGGYRYRVKAVASNATGISTSSPSAEFPAARYAVIDLGANNIGDLINDNGTVVLNAEVDLAASTQLWTQGTTTYISGFGAGGLNNSGEVVMPPYVGTSFNDMESLPALSWTADDPGDYVPVGEWAFKDLSDTYTPVRVPYQVAAGINDSGTIAGFQTLGIADGPFTGLAMAGFMVTSSGTTQLGSTVIMLGDSSYSGTMTPAGTVTAYQPTAVNYNGLIIGNVLTYSTVNFSNGSDLGPQNVVPYSASPIVSGMVWDGSEEDLTGIPAAINDTGQIVGNLTSGGTLVVWPTGNYLSPVTLLSAPGVASTLTARAINARTTTSGTTTVSAVQVLAANRLWEMDASGNFGLPVSVADYLPAGCGYSDLGVNAINKYGAIVGTATLTTTVGGTTTTASHGVLLTPREIRLLNGDTNATATDGKDFEGNRPTTIDNADLSPDNTTTTQDVTDTGTHILGDCPVGTGRIGIPFENNSYVSTTLVVAKVQPNATASGLTYAWTRQKLWRNLNIKKSTDGTQWNVTKVAVSLGSPALADDTDDGSHQTTSPSPKNLLYSYDSSGDYMVLHSSETKDDYSLFEKKFIYTLTISMGSTVVSTVKFPIGQTIVAKRVDTTGTVAIDWQGISCRASSSNIPDCQMPNDATHVAFIRSIVGGTLPIAIDSHANDN